MSPVRVIVAAAALAMALIAAPVTAHHSFGFYDMHKTTEIDGTVQKYEWSNPHCWLFLMVAGGSGDTAYGFEMQSVGEMLRKGWAKSSLRPGDKIKVKFHPMRDGTPNGLLLSATTADGALIGHPPNQ